MAKTQNLSLNPTKISGTCGRLMCCLKYEQEAYEDLIRSSPKLESFVDTPDGRGTVVELDLQRQRVKVRMEDRPEVIATFANTDIYVLRNGKAKKTDPPIPADFAPISGKGKRAKRFEDTADVPVLETIRFRYSNEAIVEEPAPAPKEDAPEALEAPEVPATQEEAPAKSRHRRNRRNRGHNKPQGEKPQGEKPQGEKPQEAKKEQPSQNGENAPKKSHRRNYHRRRRPRSGESKAE